MVTYYLHPADTRPRSLGLGRRLRRVLEKSLHVVGYYFLLKRQTTRVIRLAGFELAIPPTVYDPRYVQAPIRFASFVGKLELAGKIVADLCTGSGIQALAAARAGARKVVAIDINPHAAGAAARNAHANGFADRVCVLASDLFSAVAPAPLFDVILANPPFCDGEAWDLADRAWRAGPAYRDIAAMFEQARARLAPNGVMYIVLSSNSDLELLGTLIRQAGLDRQIAVCDPVFFETLIIYELRPC